MPGCGAFNNPIKSSAAQFLSLIKSYDDDLKKNNIDYYIVEQNHKTYKLLQDINKDFDNELGELNRVIYNIKNLEIRTKAILVKEKILACYESGEASKNLFDYILQTKQLITTTYSKENLVLLNNYLEKADQLSKQMNQFSIDLGIGMVCLGIAIAASIVILCAAAAISPVGIACSLVGGTAMLIGGVGFFVKAGNRDLNECANELVDTLKLC